MKKATDLRKRLESAAFPDLGAMMEGYARAAAELGGSEFGQKLDFTSESIDGLDEILVLVGESPELDVDFEVRLWGSYLGEVLRRRYAGVWEMTQYPGGAGCGSRRRSARLPPVSPDQGISPAHRRRRRRPAHLLCHGDRAAGQAGAGELTPLNRASRHARR